MCGAATVIVKQALFNMSRILLSDAWEFAFEVFGFDSTAERRGVVIQSLQDDGIVHLRQMVTVADTRSWEENAKLLPEEVVFLKYVAEIVRVASRRVFSVVCFLCSAYMAGGQVVAQASTCGAAPCHF